MKMCSKINDFIILADSSSYLLYEYFQILVCGTRVGYQLVLAHVNGDDNNPYDQTATGCETIVTMTEVNDRCKYDIFGLMISIV
jgi:hypothetical protein